jgi:tetratricopeptide (TPR) repeat protein
MKKMLSFVVLLAISLQLLAQSERYQKAMEQNIAAIDSTRTVDGWKDLGNTFQRIADAEKTQWLPYYYAALSHVMTGYMIGSASGGMGGFADKTDPEADAAEQLLNKAEELGKTNSEILCVRKMIATLRMMADPMNRYQTQGPLAAEALEKAKSMDPGNPRVYLLEGQDKFFTPEQFGGSKTEAKTLFEESLKKFELYKLESSIHPQWGKSQVQYFLSLLK